MGTLTLFALAVADAWPTVREELRAAYAQQTVRMQVLRQGVPWIGVFFVSMLLDRILVALVLAVLVGLLLRGGLQLVDEAAYRADGREIVRKLWRSKPSFIVVRAMQLDVDGRDVYYAEVNGEVFLHNERGELADDVVRHANAVATRRKPPGVDSCEFANYVFTWGIPDPEDWEEKLDEKIRKAALKPFRGSVLPVIGTQKRRIRREKFDDALETFDDDRVRRRLREDDLYRCLDRGELWVTLKRDPYRVEQQEQDWPALSD